MREDIAGPQGASGIIYDRNHRTPGPPHPCLSVQSGLDSVDSGLICWGVVGPVGGVWYHSERQDSERRLTETSSPFATRSSTACLVARRDPPDWPLHRIPYQTRITMSDTTRPVPRPAVSMDQHITKALAALIYTVAVIVGIYWMVKIGQLHG